MKNRVFLYPAKGKTYRATIGKFPRWITGRVLTDEGEYPVEIYLERTDLNGDTILLREEAKDRRELLEALSWTGKARQDIVFIWNYDRKAERRNPVRAILRRAWDHRMELEKKAADEFIASIPASWWQPSNEDDILVAQPISASAFDDDDLPF